ncbi:MAG: UDP-N-acetylmuramate--L-alanine ligase [bacterium]
MNKHYHLIGIGGIGMSGIAQLLLSRGFKVSGSDLKDNMIVNELVKSGAKVFIGHSQANVKGADVVVYSSAISENNPELLEAKRQGMEVIKRAQALASLMQEAIVITVTGSHGKTTTASLASYLLLEAGLRPTLAVGGILRNIESNASLGDGRFFVAEADESDGSFLYYQPKYSIITNVDYEHLDYYKSFENALNAFREFLKRTRSDGCVFACSDDANLKEMVSDYRNNYLLFGLQEGAHIYPRNIEIKGLSSEFDCFYKDKFVDRFVLSLAGLHNISNALSVIALGLELGISLDCIKKALLGYKGAKRRLEVKFKDKDYLLIDDYAHHPTEIRASLAALKNLKAERLIVIFQPHRFSRTKLLLEEFGKSFSLADYVVITDIYPAAEPMIEGVTGRLVCDKIKSFDPHKEAVFIPKEEIVRHLFNLIKPGDLVVTMGAGDIVKISDEMVEALKRQG